jgi:hypothetical protein
MVYGKKKRVGAEPTMNWISTYSTFSSIATEASFIG